MIIVRSSAGTLLHQCSYISVDEANRMLSSFFWHAIVFFNINIWKGKRMIEEEKKQITDSRLVSVIMTTMLKYSSLPQQWLTNQRDCDRVIKHTHTYTTRWIVVVVVVVVSSIEWLLALSRVCIFVCNGRRRTREAIVTYEYVHVTGDSRTRRRRRRRRRRKRRGEDEYYSHSSVCWLPSNAFFRSLLVDKKAIFIHSVMW